MSFKVNDLIIVQAQPSNMHVQIKGEHGFIEEIVGSNAQIVTFKQDGICIECKYW